MRCKNKHKIIISILGLMATSSLVLSFNQNNEVFENSLQKIEVRQSVFTKAERQTAETFFKEAEEYRMEQERIRQEQERIRREQEEARLKAEQEARQRKIEAVGTVGYEMGFTEADVDLLNRLVEAEAGSEPYQGKIAVVNVIINRIKSNKYPNNIYDVIYQPNQFEVVNIGTINTKIPSDETKMAVKEALNGAKAVGDDIKLFWADYLSKSNPIWKHCQVRTAIGGHLFSDEWK